MEINERRITPPRLVDIARLVAFWIRAVYRLVTPEKPVQGIAPIGSRKRPNVDTQSVAVTEQVSHVAVMKADG